MPYLYLYDNCTRKTIPARDPGAEPYYSGFVLRGGVRLHQVDFQREHDVCRKCKNRETGSCVRIKLEAARKRVTNPIPEPNKKDKGSVVIRFRRRG